MGLANGLTICRSADHSSRATIQDLRRNRQTFRLLPFAGQQHCCLWSLVLSTSTHYTTWRMAVRKKARTRAAIPHDARTWRYMIRRRRLVACRAWRGASSVPRLVLGGCAGCCWPPGRGPGQLGPGRGNNRRFRRSEGVRRCAAPSPSSPSYPSTCSRRYLCASLPLTGPRLERRHSRALCYQALLRRCGRLTSGQARFRHTRHSHGHLTRCCAGSGGGRCCAPSSSAARRT